MNFNKIKNSKILNFLQFKLKDEKNFIILYNGKNNKDNYLSYIYTNPVKIISCKKILQVNKTIKEIQKQADSGFHAAGYISYETGMFFENIKKDKKQNKIPLVWFGIFKKPAIFSHKTNKFINNKKWNNAYKKFKSGNIKNKNYILKCIKPNITKKEYLKNIKNIKTQIEKGNTYQVNYTFKHKFSFEGSAFSFFNKLCKNQSASYSAFIKFGYRYILSFSPEIFFKKQDRNIYVKPMKGTIKRGITGKSDNKNKENLKKSKKNRAENIMIVDLLRNDLGKISETGTVKTKILFEVEKLETLFQMTSTINAKLKKNILWYDIFKNLFPSGSVTGAPKISTMKIIKKLEKEPRSVYTGSIGYLTKNSGIFNVAIRTVLINTKSKKAEMGIGSGIVYDSNPEKEYEECLLKAKFLKQAENNFSLIETILWEKNRFFLLNSHFKRMKKSAEAFGFNFSNKTIKKQLNKKATGFNPSLKYKVKILLDKNGKFKISHNRLKKTENKNLTAVFSRKKTFSKNIFLKHKTTNRKLYDTELKKTRNKGHFEVFFLNEKNHVTEAAISNIIIKKNGRYFTPPADSGILKGIYRQYLLKKKGFPLEEKTLLKKDIEKADKIYIINSVRKISEISIPESNF